MTDNALKIIKDELAKMSESPATKALSVAVEHFQDINHGFSKSGLRYGGMQYEQISAKALTTIANILSGKDGK